MARNVPRVAKMPICHASKEPPRFPLFCSNVLRESLFVLGSVSRGGGLGKMRFIKESSKEIMAMIIYHLNSSMQGVNRFIEMSHLIQAIHPWCTPSYT